MTAQTRDQIADSIAAGLGHSFEGELVAGGHYAPVVRDGNTLYTSGQVPRVGTTVVVTAAWATRCRSTRPAKAPRSAPCAA